MSSHSPSPVRTPTRRPRAVSLPSSYESPRNFRSLLEEAPELAVREQRLDAESSPNGDLARQSESAPSGALVTISAERAPSGALGAVTSANIGYSSALADALGSEASDAPAPRSRGSSSHEHAKEDVPVAVVAPEGVSRGRPRTRKVDRDLYELASRWGAPDS